MKLWQLAWSGVRHRALASLLTAASVALGVALALSVLVLKQGARSTFTSYAQGYELVLGPTHGSQLDVVLNSMYHLGASGGTIPWEVYDQYRKDPRVKLAVPYAIGDNFRGHPVVATSQDHFEALRDADGRAIGEGVQGRLFRAGAFEATIGSLIAAREGMGLGDQFRVTHGTGEGGHEHAEVWHVVGVLRPTGTPADRALYVPLATFYAIDDHRAEADRLREARGLPAPEADGEGEASDADEDSSAVRELVHCLECGEAHADADHQVHGLTAIGLQTVGATIPLEIRRELQVERAGAQAAIPVMEIRGLLDLVGQVDRVLQIVAWLVVLVAGVGILVSLYNAVAGRRREIAILRALGATPGAVFLVIVLEAVLICVGGGLLGMLVAHGAIALVAPGLFIEYGVLVSAAPSALDGLFLGMLFVMGLIVGFVPAWSGLRTPVATHLHPED